MAQTKTKITYKYISNLFSRTTFIQMQLESLIVSVTPTHNELWEGLCRRRNAVDVSLLKFLAGGIMKLAGGMPEKLSFSQFCRQNAGKDLRLPPMKIAIAIICLRIIGGYRHMITELQLHS